MKAFHNKESVKKKYLARVRAHRKADEIIKGTYWHEGKGCAVGCTVHSGEHSAYETELGIPTVLARLEDGIFEALPNNLAQTWPERFLKAIPTGADLSQVWPKFAIWLLSDPVHGVINYATRNQTKDSINKVANLYLRSLKEEVPIADWDSARAYASASASAAYASASAAYASASASAYAYASADYAAYAYAAYAYAAYGGAREVRIAQSEKLLELLKTAPKFIRKVTK